MRQTVVLAVAVMAACCWPAVSLEIVCSTTLVADVVSQIAGPDHTIGSLLPVDADPHTFEATPADLVAISSADVVFLSGGGLEQHLAPILKDTAHKTVSLSDGLELRHASGDGHGSHDIDPHVWFDPSYVKAWTDRIAEVLGDIDPETKSETLERAEAYQVELDRLDAWIREQVATVPDSQRQLITDHMFLGYFAARYDFELVGTIFPGLSSNAEPSARDLARLQDMIISLNIPVLFVGTTVNPSLAEQIAGDTGADIVELYTGSLSEPDGPAPTYIDFMIYDVNAIVDGLTETP